jgi:hypothetical protein
MPSKSAIQKKNAEDLRLIRQAIAKDDYPIANGGLISLLERDPFCVEANRLMSLLSASVGDLPEALASAVLLTAVEAQVAAHWKLRGEIEIELRFRSSAMRSLNKAKEIDPSDYEIEGLLEKAGRL